MFLSKQHCFKSCLILLRNAHSSSEINHYKTLGLHPSASKADIKSAYYELSKKHHPDRNKGSDESARIFRNVREAYDVLGNDERRKKYDSDRIFKNIRTPTKVHYTSNSPNYQDEDEKIFYHSKARPQFRKYSYGKTSYFDFDAWFEGHYGKQNRNEYNFRHPKRFDYTHNTENKDEIKFNKRVKFVFTFLFYSMVFLTIFSFVSSGKKRTI